MSDQDWREDALCREVGWWLFFPPKGGSNKSAKDICARCPVRDACLEYGVATFQRYGIWGGKSVVEMQKIRKERGLVEPADREAA